MVRVSKFGGTSVGSAERIKEVAKIVLDSETKIVVLSAMSGTTNTLVEVVENIKTSNFDAAQALVSELKSKYLLEASKLFEEFGQSDVMSEEIENFFGALAETANQEYSTQIEKEILVQGEFITTKIFYMYLKLSGVSTEYVLAPKFMRTDRDGEPDYYYVQERLGEIMENNPNVDVFVTQGYVCKNEKGEIDNLDRGGSDYTATIIGAALRVDDVLIWTDIDGMHNNDPRYVEDTFSINTLSYEEAEELAYFGAKILHPTCIIPAHKFEVPIYLKNTMDPEARGTQIGHGAEKRRVTAIAAKDGITSIRVRSTRMLNAYGFLRKVFQVFEDYQTPIDMVTTSEVTVSMTIDNPEYLDEIVKKLQSFGQVSVFKDQTIICIVGDFHADKKGMIAQVGKGMRNVPIRMFGLGGSDINVTMVVDTVNKAAALNNLNETLFKQEVNA